jgi:molybdate transport system substrate-binding protein
MKKYLRCVLLLLFSLVTLDPDLSFAEPAKEITVSAAISLKNTFEEIGKIFEEKHPGIIVRFNFGGSGDLARQIEAGAPVDVFASAAQKDMDVLEQKGLLMPGSRRDFSANGVVVIQPVVSKVSLNSIQDLRKAEVKNIVIGNPRSVPAGRYAEQVLRHFRLWEDIRDKLIFAEHVRQALDYVARNEVDAGIVYSTDAMARPKEVKVSFKAPVESHQPVVYPIGVVKGPRNESLARDFINLVLSGKGKNILKKYGFEMVK